MVRGNLRRSRGIPGEESVLSLLFVSLHNLGTDSHVNVEERGLI